MTDQPSKYDTLDRITEEPEYCTVEVDGKACGVLIQTMTWKGSGVCGDRHRKLTGKKIEGESAQEARMKARNP